MITSTKLLKYRDLMYKGINGMSMNGTVNETVKGIVKGVPSQCQQ